MSSVLKSAYEYSESRNLVRDPYEVTNYIPALISEDGTVSFGEKKTGKLPKKVDRSTNILPNFVVESKDWAMVRGKKFDAYWGAVTDTLSKLGMKKEEKAVRSFLDAFKGADIDAVKTTWVVPVLLGRELADDLRIKKEWDSLWKSVLSDDTVYENWYQAAGKEEVLELEKSHCLVTGAVCYPARIHRKVMNAPGSGGKASFTSFGEQSYRYLGREEGDNYPISKSVSFGYTAALSHIMSKKGSSVNTSENSATLLWSADASVDLSGITMALNKFSKKEDQDLIQGKLVELSGSRARLSILSIRATTGRISSTGWDTTTVGEAAKNLMKFAEMAGIQAYTVGRTMANLGSGRMEFGAVNMRETIRSILCGQRVPRSVYLALARSVASPAAEYDVGVKAKLEIGKGIEKWT